MQPDEYFSNICVTVLSALNRVRELGEEPLEVRFCYKDFQTIESKIGGNIDTICDLRVVPDDRVPPRNAFILTGVRHAA